MMDTDHELFVRVMQAGSLSAAGRELHISPAMVSKRISRLEERLNTRLLHRTTRRLAPTPAGERLYEDMQRILAAIREAERRATGEPGAISGPLRISAPTSFGRMHIAPFLGDFLRAYPAIELELDLSDDYVDLIAARTDAAVRIGDPAASPLTNHILAPNRRLLCASPAYIEAFGAPEKIGELKGHRMLAAFGQLPWRLTGPKGPVLINGESHVRTNSSEVVRELALSGVGIALRSLWDVAQELKDGRLARVFPELEGASNIAIFAAHVPVPQVNPAVEAFIGFLREIWTPSPPWESAP